ncbi:type II secretion system F family protein [Dendrosporobacter sp. 1207_IL3150]|uniref:type II secretion system F family protein n=1 Tax=Dendrosporobacter sp. 1207_IL3150 TaxID=3084054 RepID=UPI002FD95146
MLLLIALTAFITLFIVIYLLLSTYAPTQGPIDMRLKALNSITQGRSDIDEELAKPFAQRVLLPITSDLSTVLARLTPSAIRKMVDEKLLAAGGFGGMGTEQFLGLCGFLAVALPVITAFIATLANAPVNKVLGSSIIAVAVAIAIPFILLNQKIAKRKLSIQKDLPDVLDLLTVSVEAGLGFDGALAKLSEKMKGALVDEFSRVLQEIRMGVPRREALSVMGIRCNVPDVSLFTTSLVQADQLGVSIGNVLRVQSASMREKRKQRAEEKAMKAPIKMLLPMVMFIFPTIFIVLLGPAVIQLIAAFGK